MDLFKNQITLIDRREKKSLVEIKRKRIWKKGKNSLCGRG